MDGVHGDGVILDVIETAKRTYNMLNPHPMKAFRDKISLPKSRRDGYCKVLHQLHRRYRHAAAIRGTRDFRRNLDFSV
jgi:hypothetical protein